jgi:cation:H+ antiporter
MTGLFLLAVGLVLLYVGAEGLVRGSAALALRLGLTPLVVGLTVVAFGTSSPELVVSLDAAFAGRGTIAVGNVVGSNICNVTLILGLSALIRPMKVQAQLIRLDVPIVVGCSLLLVALLFDGGLGRVEGALLGLGLAGYVAFSLYQARKEKPEVRETISGVAPAPRGAAWVEGLFVVAGLGALVAGADLFVGGAVVVAERLGVNQAVVGLTVVALGTSLPELATSVVAAIRDEGDLAIGNVIGSNIFNILGVLGVTALAHPVQREGIDLLDLGVMTAAALLLLPLMRSGFRLNRWEGALLLAFYGGYIFYLAARVL